MTGDLPLFDRLPGKPPFRRGSPEALAAWWQFHLENPRVYELFKRFAFQAINAGRERFGARMIWERMRWYVAIETKDADYKLNDHHTPFYARLFVYDFPQHDGLFEIRERKARDSMI